MFKTTKPLPAFDLAQGSEALLASTAAVTSGLRARSIAALAHLAITATVAGLLAALLFLVWFPSTVRDMVGGRELFFIVMSVDLVMGPALTFVIFNQKKTFPHLAKDLAVIGLLQLAALGFGLNTLLIARPVHINFEVDRLRVTTAADIDPAALQDAPANLRALPLWGPIRIASLKPTKPNEQLRSLDLAMAGFDMFQQPSTWHDFDAKQQDLLWSKAGSIEDLKKKWAGKPLLLQELESSIRRSGEPVENLRSIPIMSKRASWTALINAQGVLLETVKADSF